MSYDLVPPGELAAVVTFLEMGQRPSIDVQVSHLQLEQLVNPDLDAYRSLFRLVGAPWLWFSRLIMDDATLSSIVRDPRVEVFLVVDQDGQSAGLVELDFRQDGACELAFIGLSENLTGQGHGRWLLAEAVRRSWRDGVHKVHVHTCSLDHPAALNAYRRVGFVPVKRAIERFPDPRLLGILPRDCAPRIPLITTG